MEIEDFTANNIKDKIAYGCIIGYLSSKGLLSENIEYVLDCVHHIAYKQQEFGEFKGNIKKD